MALNLIFFMFRTWGGCAEHSDNNYVVIITDVSADRNYSTNWWCIEALLLYCYFNLPIMGSIPHFIIQCILITVQYRHYIILKSIRLLITNCNANQLSVLKLRNLIFDVYKEILINTVTDFINYFSTLKLHIFYYDWCILMKLPPNELRQIISRY